MVPAEFGVVLDVLSMDSLFAQERLGEKVGA
jgi:hypothetical protein